MRCRLRLMQILSLMFSFRRDDFSRTAGISSVATVSIISGAIFLSGCPLLDNKKIVYVDVRNTQKEDGRSWKTAFNTLQEAVDVASQNITEGKWDTRNISYAGSGVSNCSNSLPTITNSILWGNSVNPVYNDSTSSSSATYSCVQGGYEGTGNISEDPLFVDAANGDVRLQEGSPCIDTGTAEDAPDVNIEGTVRPQGVGFDMGAYER